MSSLTLNHVTSKKRKVVNVVLLNGENIQVYVEVKSKFQDVFNQVTTHLHLRETEYFGLAVKKDGEFYFMDCGEKIHKHAPKTWKTSHGEGFDSVGLPIFTLYFKVHFYVDQYVLLREKVTRHLYYLQLKENVLDYNHVCSEERCFQMVAFALQADHGNYSPQADGDSYFDPRLYFPAWMVQKRGEEYISKNTPVIHRDLHNVPRAEAELRFIREASMSPAAHNLHFYRLKKRKTDKIWNAWLGICAKGIEIYEEMDGKFKNLISTFLWPDIGKLCFEKKKFEIRSDGSPIKFTYYTDCDTKSRYLLSLCRTTHMFQLAIQPKLMEIRHLDAEDKRRYRESYIYSDTRDLVANGGSFRANLSPSSKSANTRFSVVSDASSNTTSGIASDKMTVSFEENDDPMSEIIIDSPPHSMLPSPGRRFSSQLPSPVKDSTFSTLPNYMPSTKAKLNRSPNLDTRPQELYKSASVGRPGGVRPGERSPTVGGVRPGERSPTVGTFRSGERSPTVGGVKSGDRSPNIGRQIAGRLTPSPGTKRVEYPPHQSPKPVHLSEDSTQSGASSITVLSSNDQNEDIHRTNQLGSFRGMLPQQTVISPIYSSSRTVPVYVASTSSSSFSPSEVLSFSQPVSRSTSRADSFKKTMGQLQIHNSDSYLPHISTMSDAVLHPTALETLAGNVDQLHLSPSSDRKTGTTHGLKNLSASSSGDYTEELMMTLPEASQEYLAPPPPMFADSMRDRTSDSSLSLTLNSSDASSFIDQRHSKTNSTESLETRSDQKQALDSSLDDSAKSVRTQISVKNQKEVLHPELQEIRGQSDAFALPLITALCNDKSLMHSGSQNASMCGSYDMSTMRSTDSHLSRLSHESDPRRLSSCYPGASGTMMALNSSRPFSWHSEHFDLDSQLAAMQGGFPTSQNLSENHRSVPQDLSGILVAPNSSWAHALLSQDMAYQHRMMEHYSPDSIASRMIPPKISSGGHNSNTTNISQNDNVVGIA